MSICILLYILKQAKETCQVYICKWLNKAISCTNLCCGVLTRFAVEIFFLRVALRKKTKNYYQQDTYEGKLSTFPQPSALLVFQEIDCLNAIITTRSANNEPLEVCPRGT